MKIIDTHEFYSLYRGDKDFRVSHLLAKNHGHQVIALVPNVTSPDERSFFRTKFFPINELVKWRFHQNFHMQLIKSKLIVFNNRDFTHGGFFQFSPGYLHHYIRLKPEIIIENPQSTLTPRSYFTFFYRFIKRFKIPVIFNDCGDIIRKGKIKQLLNHLEKIIINTNSILIIYNELGKRRFIKEYNFPHDRIFVIPKPIDTKRFNPSISYKHFQRKYGIPQDKIIISYMGRICSNKGANILAEIAKEFWKEKLNQYHFSFCGGSISNEVTQLSKYLEGYKNVTITGKLTQREMILAYAMSDLIVFPDVSNPPGFSTVLAEALSMGKAIIIGIKGFEKATPLIHRKNAWIVKPASTVSIKESILDLISNEKIKKQLEINARRLAVEKMDYNVIVRQYNKLINSIA